VEDEEEVGPLLEELDDEVGAATVKLTTKVYVKFKDIP
jgi:hypothetical protein